MSTDELTGRVCAIEVIAMMSLGMYLANSKNDPDYQKAAALIDHMRHAIAENAKALPAGARPHATRHGNHLLDTVSENLRALRGEGGQLN